MLLEKPEAVSKEHTVHKPSASSMPSPFGSDLANIALFENIAQSYRLVVFKYDTDSKNNAE